MRLSFLRQKVVVGVHCEKNQHHFELIKVTQFCCQSGADTPLGIKNPTMDSTERTAIVGFFASGDRCPAITTKLRADDIYLTVLSKGDN